MKLEIMTERPTDRPPNQPTDSPTNRQTDIRRHREVSLPKIFWIFNWKGGVQRFKTVDEVRV